MLARFGLYTHEGFLEAELCAALLAQMRSSDAKPATLRRAEDPRLEYVDEQERRSLSATVLRAAAMAVEQRLHAIRPSLEEHFGLELQGFRPTQYLRYRTGDFFRPHTDAREDQDSAPADTQRQVSVVIFLNGSDPAGEEPTFGGGELSLFGLFDQDRGVGLPVTAEPGLLVAFRSTIIHSVPAVTRGERYTVVTRFN